MYQICIGGDKTGLKINPYGNLFMGMAFFKLGVEARNLVFKNRFQVTRERTVMAVTCSEFQIRYTVGRARTGAAIHRILIFQTLNSIQMNALSFILGPSF